jgi:hypothetical protein
MPARILVQRSSTALLRGRVSRPSARPSRARAGARVSFRSPGTLARQPGAYEDSALKAPQHLDILLKGARGKLLALLHQGDATAGEIETAVAGMYDQARCLS